MALATPPNWILYTYIWRRLCNYGCVHDYDYDNDDGNYHHDLHVFFMMMIILMTYWSSSSTSSPSLFPSHFMFSLWWWLSWWHIGLHHRHHHHHYFHHNHHHCLDTMVYIMVTHQNVWHVNSKIPIFASNHWDVVITISILTSRCKWSGHFRTIVNYLLTNIYVLFHYTTEDKKCLKSNKLNASTFTTDTGLVLYFGVLIRIYFLLQGHPEDQGNSRITTVLFHTILPYQSFPSWDIMSLNFNLIGI